MNEEQTERLVQIEEENVQLQLELEATNKRNHDFEQEIESLKGQLLEQKETIDNLIAEMQTALFSPPGGSSALSEGAQTAADAGFIPASKGHGRSESDELELLLSATMEDRDRLQEEVESLKQELALSARISADRIGAESASVASHDKEKQETAELERILEMTMEERDELQKQLDAARSELDSVRTGEGWRETDASARTDEERTDLENRFSQLMTEHDELQMKLKQAQDELDTLRKAREISSGADALASGDLASSQPSDTGIAQDARLEEIRALKRQIETMKQTIKSLAAQRVEPIIDASDKERDRAALSELRSELTDTKHELEERDHRMAELDGVLQQKEELIEELRRQLDDASNVSSEAVEPDLSVLQARQSEWDQERETLLKRIELSKIKIDELNSTLQNERATSTSSGEHHREELEEVSADFKLRIAELELTITDLNNELRENTRSLAAVENAKSSAEERIAALLAEVQSTRDVVDHKEDEFYQEMAKRESELQERLKSLEESGIEHQRKMAEHEQERREFAVAADEMRQRQTALSNTIEQQNNTLAEKIAALEQREAELVSIRTQAEEGQSSLSQRLDEIETEKNRLEEQLQALHTESEQRQRLIADLETAGKQLRETVERLERSLGERSAEAEEFSRKREASDVENTRLHVIIKELNARLANSQDVDAEVVSLREEQDSLKVTMQQAENTWRELVRQKEDRLEQFEIMTKTELQTKDDQIAMLKTEVEHRLRGLSDLQEENRKLSVQVAERTTEKDKLDQELREVYKLKSSGGGPAAAGNEQELQLLGKKVQEQQEQIDYIMKRAREMKTFYENKIATLQELSQPPAQMTGYTVDTNVLSRENEQLRQKIFSLENLMKEREDNIATLRGELYALKDKSGEGQSSVSGSVSGLMQQEVESQFEDLKRILKDRDGQLLERDEIIKRMQWQKANRDTSISKAVTQMRKLRNEIDVLTKRKTKDSIGQQFDELEDFIRKL